MSLILKLLGSAFGPYLSSGLLIALVLGLATSCVQSKRLETRTKERDEARQALINPDTKKTWESEARRDARDLATCQDNTRELDAALEASQRAVAGVVKDGEARTARAEREASAARKLAQSATRRAEQVLAAKPGPDLCVSAELVLRGRL